MSEIKLLDILVETLVEQEKDQVSGIEVDEMLDRFKILRKVLEALLISNKGSTDIKKEDLNKLIAGITFVSFKPATFKVSFQNGSSMNLKYNPTPEELDDRYKDSFTPKDYFTCQILGKRFSLQNRAEFLQALDYIAKALDGAPIGSTQNQTTQDQNEPEDTDSHDNSQEKKEKEEDSEES